MHGGQSGSWEQSAKARVYIIAPVVRSPFLLVFVDMIGAMVTPLRHV
jgi:hypothetical protein